MSRISSTGIWIDSNTIFASSGPSTNPVSGESITGNLSQIIEFDLNSGKAKDLATPKTERFYQQVSPSPDFSYVFYDNETSEVDQGLYLSQPTLLDRSTGQTSVISLSKGTNQVTTWLDNDNFILSHRVMQTTGLVVDSLYICKASMAQCQAFLPGYTMN